MSIAAGDWSFDAIGTRWRVTTPEPLTDADRARVAEIVADFDRTWSRFRDDSAVSALAAGGEVPEPADAAAMLDAYTALSEATGGAVNPLVGASLIARGYDAASSLTDRGAVPAPEHWRSQLSWGAGMLRLAGPAVIDVGALGKGRLVDLVLAELTARVDGPLTVDASGDIALRGTERIALEHPYDPATAIGVWEVTDAALCASATNRRAWAGLDGQRLHHVLDARTGIPVTTVAATWALAPTAMIADAVATALFFPGGPEIAHRWGAHWVRMTTDGRVEWSPDCTAELFLAR